MPTIITVPTPVNPSPQQLWETVAHKAFAFFWNESHPKTGLTKDRARNLFNNEPDPYTVASIAATGYMLAALPIAVTRGWISKPEAADRALTTLRFMGDKMTHNHGFFYHFIDWTNGERMWQSELSSIDTALLMKGVLVAGVFFGGEIRDRADKLFARVDWQWMQGRAASDSSDTFVTMGWKPEDGFLKSRWSEYNEASYLYLLALGAPTFPLPPSVWDKWGKEETTMEGFKIPGNPGPLFFAQMTPAYFDLHGMRDRSGRDWWTLWGNTHRAHYAYCARNPKLYPPHRTALWGINACDQPPSKPGENNGYGAQDPVDKKNDGTIAPTAALAGVTFLPDVAERTLMDIFENYWTNGWGKYGFSNAINPARNWFDVDVIGIDLGMMLLAVENYRGGLIWKLMRQHPVAQKGIVAAGFRMV